jgi:hypothetical protein
MDHIQRISMDRCWQQIVDLFRMQTTGFFKMSPSWKVKTQRIILQHWNQSYRPSYWLKELMIQRKLTLIYLFEGHTFLINPLNSEHFSLFTCKRTCFHYCGVEMKLNFVKALSKSEIISVQNVSKDYCAPRILWLGPIENTMNTKKLIRSTVGPEKQNEEWYS